MRSSKTRLLVKVAMVVVAKVAFAAVLWGVHGVNDTGFSLKSIDHAPWSWDEEVVVRIVNVVEVVKV